MGQLSTFISRESPLALYYQLKQLLVQQIESGVYAVGAKLPSEQELEEMYGVSRTTVRQAINELVQEGLLYRQQGKGTFVAHPRVQPAIHRLTSFTEDIRARGMVPSSKLVEFREQPAGRYAGKKLGISPEHPVIFMHRLRLANGEPIGLHKCYLPLAPEIVRYKEQLESVDSLYGFLEQHGIILADADETLEVTTAQQPEAELLQIPVDSALLLIQRTTYDRLRRPIEFVKILYRADRYKYHIHMVR